MSDVRNLDENVQESFDFIVNGHTYKFVQPTTEEVDLIIKMDDSEKVKTEICKYISPVSEGAPEFRVTLSQMIIPKFRKFMEMIKTEFGA